MLTGSRSATDQGSTAREALRRRIWASRERAAGIAARLLRAPSENPPGDTRAAAEVAAAILAEAEGAEIAFATAEEPVVNLVARIRGAGPGRRLVFNGHLDTYPAGDRARWSVDPYAGVIIDGRLHGRGAADMKGGIACSLLAFLLLAECREAWRGEAVVTLAGDEEVMGLRGTGHLLESVPHANGDAMICGDAGSPKVLRFGEKGFIWLTLTASGRAAHGAHVHLGESAIERMQDALARLQRLRRVRIVPPPEVARAIRRSSSVSEPLSGPGEARILRSITVNCGLIAGGSAPNLVADRAEARVDVRLPVGVTVAELTRRIDEALAAVPGISYHIDRACEPNFTDPEHEIIRLALAAGREALGRTPAVNMRVGASDARLYRLRGVPSVVCGLTPHNMGAPDEFIDLEELFAVAYMHTITAFDFLSAAGPERA